ncbi:hypothetical protein CAEBREN_08348 [Caenorhabditis brenneri]|uniref:Uncharacterized protein n=1 Tax=Caenorhabditis brenneri TaxID=135651 RepID=G0P155_CAEBE|nr:hypothetical protein CAEBREN_08348 [Caenorhabditis brenneri]
MVKYPTTPPKDFSWLGRPAPVPAPPPVQAPPTPTSPRPVQIKEEVPDEDDSFDCFPRGAEPYTREELFARMRERGRVQGPEVPVNGTPDSFDQFQADNAHAPTPRNRGASERPPATDFSAMMKQEVAQPPLLEPKQEPIDQDVHERAAPRFLTPTNTLTEAPIAHNALQAQNAENGQMVVAPQENLALPTIAIPAALEPTVESAMMSAIHQLMHTKDPMEISIRRTNGGITLSVVKTPEKDATQLAMNNEVAEIPDSQASDVVVRPRRRLRVVDPSDDEQSDHEEDEEYNQHQTGVVETAILSSDYEKLFDSSETASDGSTEDLIKVYRQRLFGFTADILKRYFIFPLDSRHVVILEKGNNKIYTNGELLNTKWSKSCQLLSMLPKYKEIKEDHPVLKKKGREARWTI